MIKKSLLILMVFVINGCVGTIKVAEGTETNINDSNTNSPAVTKGATSESEK